MDTLLRHVPYGLLLRLHVYMCLRTVAKILRVAMVNVQVANDFF